MGLIVNENAKEFKRLEAGSYLATCFGIVDLGVQPQEFEGKKVLSRQKMMLFFEIDKASEDDDGNPLVLEREDGKPFVITNEYTSNLSPKSKLKEHLNSWRGRPFTDEELASFNVAKLLGVTCMVAVDLNSKGYNKILALSKPIAGLPKPKPSLPKFIFDDTAPDVEVWAMLPNWVKNKINDAENWDAICEALGDAAFSGQTDSIDTEEVAF
jgi:hypothetical protein